MNSAAGNFLIVLGILAVVAGVLMKTGLLGWFGNLPGDIQIRREGFRFYFPLTSMILISVAVSLLMALVRRLF